MSELDFDELDKAVNNLMGDVPRVEPPKNDDVKTLNISSTLPDSARPSLDELNSALSQVNGPVSQSAPAPAPVATPAPTPVQEPVTPRATTPPLAQRRGGRFMDVVHPSSDMKNVSKPVLSGPRQGVTIQPTGQPVTSEADDTTPATLAVETPEPTPTYTAPAVPDTEPSTSSSAAPSSEWPDPLDMPGYDAGAETTSPAEAEPAAPVAFGAPAPVTTPEAPFDESDDDDDDLFTIDDEPEEEPQPLTTPFLADAKVEKRPLGSPAVDEPSDELSHAPVLGELVDESTDTPKAEDQLPAEPEDVSHALPPELQSDLMAVETDGDTTTGAEVATPEVVAEPTVAPAVEAPVAEPAPVVPTGPTSIPQQYHEEKSTGDQPSGSIYDTDSYHQPLAHPAKTKSGWLWIIWILLLLIVGGGGAVALYFLGII